MAMFGENKIRPLLLQRLKGRGQKVQDERIITRNVLT